MPKEITLTQGRVAIVDDEDYPLVSSMRWCFLATRKGYAVRNSGGGLVYMHRFIMQAPQGMEVDHINGDTLDNRRVNLRLATRSQNARNKVKTKQPTSSRYIGVHRQKRYKTCKKPYIAIMNSHYLGGFLTEEDAARAYDAAARAEYVEFARLNFPDTHELVT